LTHLAAVTSDLPQHSGFAERPLSTEKAIIEGTDALSHNSVEPAHLLNHGVTHPLTLVRELSKIKVPVTLIYKGSQRIGAAPSRPDGSFLLCALALCERHYGGMPELVGVVGEELNRSGASEVERLLFGTSDPVEIAQIVEDFCRDRLGQSPATGLFYRGSVGCVFGVALADGTEVVLKVYQARWTKAFLTAVGGVQRHLAAHGFPCPQPLLAPTPLSNQLGSLVTVERLLPDPGLRPFHGPGDRAAAAGGLAEQIALCRRLELPDLGPHPLETSSDGLYPEPHSPLFDFTATAQGAEWIDEFARRAQQLRNSDPTPPIPAHTDWSARNIRICDGQLVAVYDWDSVAFTTESTAVGQAAATWSVTSEPDGSEFPDIGEICGFVRDYERAAGRELPAEQWSATGASAAWVLAYTARCEHSLTAKSIARSDQHGARDRLASDGNKLLALSRS
jgi:hypothetical protein